MLQQTELIFDFASDHHSMSQVSKWEAVMLDIYAFTLFNYL